MFGNVHRTCGSKKIIYYFNLYQIVIIYPEVTLCDKIIQQRNDKGMQCELVGLSDLYLDFKHG